LSAQLNLHAGGDYDPHKPPEVKSDIGAREECAKRTME
jgi:hypothetical protein